MSANIDIKLAEAFIEMPEVPSKGVLLLLRESALSMSVDGVDLNAIGVDLQKKHGLSAIPPECGAQCAAGLWFKIREGLLK